LSVASTRAGITFVATPPWISVTESTSRNAIALALDVARLEAQDLGEAVEGEGDRVHAEPRPRRVRRPALEDDARGEVAEAAELQRVVRRLQADHQLGLVHDGRRLEQRGQRVLVRPDLLAREEQQREVVGQLGLGRPAPELDHHGEPALHVARAQAVDGAVGQPAGEVSLLRHRVGVAREEDERLPVTLREQQRLAVVVGTLERNSRGDVPVHHLLVARRRGDVDQRKRAFGEHGFRGGSGHNGCR